MAVVELGWSPADFWHRSWHEFHGSIGYLAEKRRKEAEAVRSASGRGRSFGDDAPRVKVKGMPEQIITKRRPLFNGGADQPAPPSGDFAAFRDSIYAKFGTRLVGWH